MCLEVSVSDIFLITGVKFPQPSNCVQKPGSLDINCFKDFKLPIDSSSEVRNQKFSRKISSIGPREAISQGKLLRDTHPFKFKCFKLFSLPMELSISCNKEQFSRINLDKFLNCDRSGVLCILQRGDPKLLNCLQPEKIKTMDRKWKTKEIQKEVTDHINK